MSFSSLIHRAVTRPAHAVLTPSGYVAKDGYTSHADLASMFDLEDANMLSVNEHGVVQDLLKERGILESMAHLYD